MKKIILLLALTFVTSSLFAQMYGPKEQAILKLMTVKKGMVSINSLSDNMSKDMSTENATNFKAEMDVYKKELVSTALETFKADYTAKEIDAIYKECTSDKINYTDLTNNFFKKWRRLKSDLYFSKAKETYFKYQ